MTKEELVRKLKTVMDIIPGEYRSQEEWHHEADGLLLDYINDSDVSKAYDGIRKWYS